MRPFPLRRHSNSNTGSNDLNLNTGSAHEVIRKKKREITFFEKLSSNYDRFLAPFTFIILMFGFYYMLKLSLPISNNNNNNNVVKQPEHIEEKIIKTTQHLINRKNDIKLVKNLSTQPPLIEDIWCYVENDIEYCLPQLIGVCCVRSGSTALSEYLNAHPFLSFGKYTFPLFVCDYCVIILKKTHIHTHQKTFK